MKKVLALFLAFMMISVMGLAFFSATETGSYLLGDVDNDGEVTIIDAAFIQRVLAHMTTDEDGMYTLRGDIDGDGELTAVDASFIGRHCAYLSTPYPIGEPVIVPTEAPTETIAPTDAPTQAPPQAPTQRPTAKPDPYELPPI